MKLVTMHSTQNSHLTRICAVFVLVLGTLLGSAARGQELYGTLIGTVQDKTGAVVPNAAVTITSQETGDARMVTSDGHGSYRFVNLLAGQYTVSVKAAGSFSGFTEKNIVIEVSREARIDVMLQPATVTQEVVVGTAAPELQTESAEVNHEISESMISELPITSTQGRNFEALYTLVPGAAAVAEQNSTASNPSRAMSANINGVEYNSNTTRIDGAVNYYGWLPYLIAYVPPADSIQSVNLVTNSFNAEQGVAGGASISITLKSGTRSLHGGAWEYNQIFNTNARAYTGATPAAQPQIPKNIFNQFGFNLGGPVYIPHILTGRRKLFFFENFERTTRRQLITGLQTVPTPPLLTGDFTLTGTTLYDPQPGGVPATGANQVNGYLTPGFRPTFMSEYGCNCIPGPGAPVTSPNRQSTAAITMLALLKPISAQVTNPNYAGFLANDYNGSGTLAYNRNTSDTKITYVPNDKSTLFGHYSIEPFTVSDPQELGPAGGGTFDGGQPGAALGRIQNVGIGYSHIINSRLVVDADFGYTRQVTGAQSSLDIADGDFGLNQLGIPGTNGVGPNYEGQPEFVFNNSGTDLSSLGNSNGANPFLFRDNQFTGDVNVSFSRGKHAMKAGFTYYHFDLNHFQPTSGGGVSSPRGGFDFAGGLTTAGSSGNTYNALADLILGLPNNGTGIAVAKETQQANPNTLRWSEYGFYAQDQWNVTPKLTASYGVRYEYYPMTYRDHEGIARMDVTLPLAANVEIGGVGGNPENAGVNVGKGIVAPRLGLAYRVTQKTVVRSGFGITEDPDSMRFLRDSFPNDISPTYVGPASNTVSVNPLTGTPLTLTTGIPAPTFPTITNGYASLGVSGSTNTIPKNYRRGYIESWNLFVQSDLGHNLVANVGYVGTHQVRQLIGLGYNAAPLPSGTTLCMANGQYNPSSPYYTNPLGSNPCSFNANQIINQSNCTPALGGVCYNTGGVTINEPLLSANYNGLQTQLTRNASRLAQYGVVYTWSHAFDYEDNGAGSGSGGLPITYPGYFALDRARSSYDRTNNLQLWAIYHLPFGSNQKWANHGFASAILGGFQLNGQFSHISGSPFSVTAANGGLLNSPGNTAYATLVAPYRQVGGHARSAIASSGIPASPVSGGNPWFDPSSFGDLVETVYGSAQATLAPGSIAMPTFGNTHRNEFRGPGTSYANASIFRAFHIYHEAQFQIRVEAFNITNHPQLSSPNASVPSGACPAGDNEPAGTVSNAACSGPLAFANGNTFGYITSFGGTRTVQYSGRITF